jgi:hypothetical protein
MSNNDNSSYTRRNVAKVEYDMLYHTGSYWGHGICVQRAKETLKTILGKYSVIIYKEKRY